MVCHQAKFGCKRIIRCKTKDVYLSISQIQKFALWLQTPSTHNAKIYDTLNTKQINKFNNKSLQTVKLLLMAAQQETGDYHNTRTHPPHTDLNLSPTLTQTYTHTYACTLYCTHTYTHHTIHTHTHTKWCTHGMQHWHTSHTEHA